MGCVKWKIHNQDVIKWAREYNGEPFHSMLCDPPYELKFMNKGWDGTGIAFNPETWYALGQHLYDGAFIMAYAGTRGYHRMAVAIEDAGFIIHPVICWIQGQGFPKATRVKDSADFEGYRYGLQALKPSVEMICVAQKPYSGRSVDNITKTGAGALWIDGARIGIGADKEDGGHAGLSPIHGGGITERVATDHSIGRWPANVVLQHTPECRKNGTKKVKTAYGQPVERTTSEGGMFKGEKEDKKPIGFSDADGMEEVAQWECVEGCPVKAFPTGRSAGGGDTAAMDSSGNWYGKNATAIMGENNYNDSGSASRFFLNADWSYEIAERLNESAPFMYTPKASRGERDAGLEDMPLVDSFMVESKTTMSDPRMDRPQNRNQLKNSHPTVKPISLNKWLATLLLPPDRYAPRRILNPFSGVASEAIGALLTGWEEIVMIESDTEYGYCDIAEARLQYWNPKIIVPDDSVPRQISMF